MAFANAALLADQPESALEASTEALALLPDEPTSVRAKLLGVHAHALSWLGQDESAARYATEALAVAQKLDLSSVVAAANTTLAAIDERAGDPDTAKRTLEQIVAQARRDGDVEAEMRGLYLLGGLHHERGLLEEAQTLFAAAAASGRSAHRPWAPYAFDGRWYATLTAYQRGRWDEALALSDTWGEQPPPVAEGQLLAARSSVLAGRGDPAAPALLARLEPLWERDGLLALTSAGVGIDVHGDRGDLAAMLALHDRAVEVLTGIWTEYFSARIRLSALLAGQLARASTTAPLAERSALGARVPDLQAVLDGVRARIATRKRPFGPEGQAWDARLRAELLRLRWLTGVAVPDEDGLVEVWQETVVAFEAMGHLFETARSRVRLGEVLRAAGRGAEAQTHLEARACGRRASGCTPAAGRAGGHRCDRGSGRASRRPRGALTARESEILGLVAEGRSNGDIARQLFISTKTVSVHVSNILAKLGASGRTEAAAIARREALIP